MQYYEYSDLEMLHLSEARFLNFLGGTQPHCPIHCNLQDSQ